MADKPPSFAAKHSDPRTVSSALAGAEASWRRGERAEALKALRRAVEAASDAELDSRALELAKTAADLATQIDTIPPSVKGGQVSLPPRSSQNPLKTLPSKIAPTPLKAASHTKEDSPSSVRGPASTKEEAKKADRKSLAGEVVRGRTVPGPDDGTVPVRAVHLHEPPPARKKANSRADKTERAAKRASRTDEIDEWPTEALSAGELPEALAVTSTGTPTVGPISQAARVMVWREADGSVRIATVGSPAPADAVEAILAALEPDGDIRALLRDRR